MGSTTGGKSTRSARRRSVAVSLALATALAIAMVAGPGAGSGAQSPAAKHSHAPGDDFIAYGGRAGRHTHSHGGETHSHPRVASPQPDKRLEGKSTLDQTIVGGDPATGYQFLSFGPGEPRILREDLAKAKSGRAKRRVTLAYLGHLTDFQVSDEESPARVEFLDITANPPLPNALSAAHRPQEALVAHGADAAIRQMNDFTSSSPHRSRGLTPTAWPKSANKPGADAKTLGKVVMNAALMTGDLADNQQFNETEWVIQLLEGGTVDPNSGIADFSSCPLGPPPGRLAEPRNYAGVQDKRNHPLGATGLLDSYYDPQGPGGVFTGWPRYPGLLDRAQEQFTAAGLRYENGDSVASYVVFGNHDGLAQGNQAALAPFEAIGIGCIKPLVAVSNLPSLGLEADDLPDILDLDPGSVMLVPPDPKRRYVDKAQFKEIAESGRQADGHGFGFVDTAEQEASAGAAGYYAFDLKPGLRMIGLDTLCEGGITGPAASGNIDEPQWQWLSSELARAQAAGKLIIVFGHHPIRSLTCDVPDEMAPPCTVNDAHGHDLNPGCDRDPRDSRPLHLGGDLTTLLQDHPNVIAYIGGHTHEQALNEFAPPPGSEGKGSFWGIETASLVDWPPQSRLLEVVDNCDGTLSILGTVLDTKARAAAPRGDDPATPEDEADVVGMDLGDFASIARTLAYNDHQAGPAVGGQGTPETRNVELVINDPRPTSSAGCAAAVEKPGGGGKGKSGACANVEQGNRKGNRITGTRRGDKLIGFRGNDVLRGRKGRDCLYGGRGHDELRGGRGQDTLRGGRGNDVLKGGRGSDQLRGAKGRDEIRGGPGHDRIKADDGSRDRIRCGKGRDLVIADERDRVSGDCERVRRR